MHGFICVVPLDGKVSPIEFSWKKPFAFQGEMVKRRKQCFFIPKLPYMCFTLARFMNS